MTEEEPYLEHIESKQIEKLIDSLYGCKPENIVTQDTHIPEIQRTSIDEKIDQLLQQTPEKPKKRVFFFRKRK